MRTTFFAPLVVLAISTIACSGDNGVYVGGALGRGIVDGAAAQAGISGFLYHVSADSVLFAHVLFVAFVVVGLALILVGKLVDWAWVRNPWFRLTHLIAIGVVALQSWLGVICPLTTLEMALRQRAGDDTYAGSFVSNWLESLLYFQAPAWVFTVCYTVFAAIVVASWYWVRPRPFSRSTQVMPP